MPHKSDLCNIFVNRSRNSYKPLRCKPITVDTRTIGETGRANKQAYFFLMKPNTIRENATLDLLYPTELWLRKAATDVVLTLTRVTVAGDTRITVDGDIRVVREVR